MSNRWSSITLQALAFGDVPIKASIPRYQRQVCFAGGAVAHSVPIVVRYRGKRRVALRMAERLKRNGYQDVRVQRERKNKGASCHA